jgi:4-hydroxybutyryl-CoA dehydratase/vinylacetyl-CoA-Delta-isomerase
VVQCITDAKGNRARRPSEQHDPDAYVHVVDRTRQGVIVRGAKLHITGASLGHELLTIPTKGMRGNEAEYAIACLVPVQSPGVRIVDVTSAGLGDDRDHPVSTQVHYPDGFVIFDDVFVPNERIMLDGEVGEATLFAHSLGLWERVGGLSSVAEEADVLVGLAQLIAEANGTAGIHHVKEKIGEMMVQATLIRASLEAALSNCKPGFMGAVFPDELFTNAGKYFAVKNYGVLLRNLQDIAGGSTVTAPRSADLDNDVVGPLIRKYMAGAAPDSGEYRTRLFHAIRDATADAYGGWKQVARLNGGGGLFAQLTVTRKHYDLDRAKAAALASSGLSTHERSP